MTPKFQRGVTTGIDRRDLLDCAVGTYNQGKPEKLADRQKSRFSLDRLILVCATGGEILARFEVTESHGIFRTRKIK
jgi:hypothetical protein